MPSPNHESSVAAHGLERLAKPVTSDAERQRPDRTESSRSDSSGHWQRSTLTSRSNFSGRTFAVPNDAVEAAVRYAEAIVAPVAGQFQSLITGGFRVPESAIVAAQATGMGSSQAIRVTPSQLRITVNVADWTAVLSSTRNTAVCATTPAYHRVKFAALFAGQHCSAHASIPLGNESDFSNSMGQLPREAPGRKAKNSRRKNLSILRPPPQDIEITPPPLTRIRHPDQRRRPQHSRVPQLPPQWLLELGLAMHFHHHRRQRRIVAQARQPQATTHVVDREAAFA